VYSEQEHFHRESVNIREYRNSLVLHQDRVLVYKSVPRKSQDNPCISKAAMQP
jgi:hypothetical protein